jgi:hypothetical protein
MVLYRRQPSLIGYELMISDVHCEFVLCMQIQSPR